MNELRTITVSQPYANLIATGEKWVENRTRQTHCRGLLGIHAGLGTQFMNVAEMKEKSLIRGAIVAVVKLVTCIEVDVARRAYEVAGSTSPQIKDVLDHEHTHGPFAWVLEDAVQLPEPVAARGAQGFWYPNKNTLAEVVRQYTIATTAIES